VDALLPEPSLKAYHLLPAVRGDLLRKLGRFEEARAEFERAASLTENVVERELMQRRAAQCTAERIAGQLVTIDLWRLTCRTFGLSGSNVRCDLRTSQLSRSRFRSACTTRWRSITGRNPATSSRMRQRSITWSPQRQVDSPARWVARWRRARLRPAKAISRRRPRATLRSRTACSSSSAFGSVIS